MTVDFSSSTIITHSKGVGWGKFAIFNWNCHLSRRQCKKGRWSYAAVSLAMTLSDLRRGQIFVAISIITYVWLTNKKLSWCWQTWTMHLEVSQVIEHSTIPYVRYFSCCAIVTTSLRRAVFPIFDFRNVMTLKTRLAVCQGHWKCHRSIERILLPIDVL